MSNPQYVTDVETTPEKLWQAPRSGDFTERYWTLCDILSGWLEVITSLKCLLETAYVLNIDPPAAAAMEASRA